MAFVIYEMDETGVNGEQEAGAVHWYCSPKCQNEGAAVLPLLIAISVSPEENNDFVAGTICESCDKPLAE